jgi:hypothetical protein
MKLLNTIKKKKLSFKLHLLNEIIKYYQKKNFIKLSSTLLKKITKWTISKKYQIHFINFFFLHYQIHFNQFF